MNHGTGIKNVLFEVFSTITIERLCWETGIFSFETDLT